MSIGSVLSARRKALGLSQNALVARLEQEDIHVTKQAVSKWETDRVTPNAEQFLALCKILRIQDVLGEFLNQPGDVFSGLNRLGRERVREYAALLRKSAQFRQPLQEEPPRPLRMLPLYELAVSAGTGQFLDGENYEMVECGVEVPEGSNFGVRVAGDSMEPRFHNGQTIWVRQQRTLMSGEIGIFLYDGEAYLKELVLADGAARLHSLNPKYRDIVVSSTLPLRVLGKVLS